MCSFQYKYIFLIAPIYAGKTTQYIQDFFTYIGAKKNCVLRIEFNELSSFHNLVII